MLCIRKNKREGNAGRFFTACGKPRRGAEHFAVQADHLHIPDKKMSDSFMNGRKKTESEKRFICGESNHSYP
jgi:hypothetical protein